jgi:uncharacterized protein (UPF0264 family)
MTVRRSAGSDIALASPGATDAPGPPLLLVSVRNRGEAEAALDGGADWIDLKEPLCGPLGCVALVDARRAHRAVGDRRPLSLAAGELRDWSPAATRRLLAACPVRMVKLGLAGSADEPAWRDRWRAAQAQCAAAGAALATVAYADWRRAGSPPPEELLGWGVAQGSPALLVDTFDKRRGGLLQQMAAAELAALFTAARAAGMTVAAAGSLGSQALRDLPLAAIDIVAIRTAACVPDRQGRVSPERVRGFRGLLHEAARSAAESA